MEIQEIRARFAPAIKNILDACSINESFVDKDQFRVYIATIWGNAVLEPEQSGILETELDLLHDYLNEEIQSLLGKDETVTTCFEYLASRVGEDAMTRLNLSAQHKAFIEYFSGLILGLNAKYE